MRKLSNKSSNSDCLASRESESTYESIWESRLSSNSTSKCGCCCSLFIHGIAKKFAARWWWWNSACAFSILVSTVQFIKSIRKVNNCTVVCSLSRARCLTRHGMRCSNKPRGCNNPAGDLSFHVCAQDVPQMFTQRRRHTLVRESYYLLIDDCALVLVTPSPHEWAACCSGRRSQTHLKTFVKTIEQTKYTTVFPSWTACLSFIVTTFCWH
jgi:hypothetical protein